jgi:hypothetical protein
MLDEFARTELSQRFIKGQTQDTIDFTGLEQRPFIAQRRNPGRCLERA